MEWSHRDKQVRTCTPTFLISNFLFFSGIGLYEPDSKGDTEKDMLRTHFLHSRVGGPCLAILPTIVRSFVLCMPQVVSVGMAICVGDSFFVYIRYG